MIPNKRHFGDKPVTLMGHADNVWSVAFSPSTQLLASGSTDHTIRLWNTKTKANIATLNGHSSTINSIAFSPDGKILASGPRYDAVKLWDVGSGAQIATLEGHYSSALSVAFSPGGSRLISGSHNSTIRLWDVKSRANINILKGHSGEVRSVAFSPDGQRIASGSGDKTIRLWDVRSDGVTSVAFSRNGKYLASGSWDNTIRLWNAATGVYLATLDGHSNTVRSVAFTPDSKHIASGSFDKTIRLWDVTSRSHISTLRGHSSPVYTITFSPDGDYLASGSGDQTVRIWSVFLGDAQDTQDPIFESNPVTSTQSTTNSQQDTNPSVSILIPPNIDITGDVSLGIGKLLGSGRFGDVILGAHKHRGNVALKKPRGLPNEALIRRFLREVEIWRKVSYKYILPCLGACKIGEDVYIVSPFIENGDLHSYMASGKTLNRSKLLYEVAQALAHLHEQGILHGDVKAQNILVGGDGSALLCDFGLAKVFDAMMMTSTQAKGDGSTRWMAPELFEDESRSTASDVYSFGITIAEVVSGCVPYPEISNNVAVISYVAFRDGRPTKHPLASPEGKSYAILWETAEKCWVKQANLRPAMTEVLGMLSPPA